MANTFKKVIDRLMWAQVAPSPNAHAAGTCLAVDMRNNSTRNSFVYNLVSNTVLNRYNIVTKGWNFVQSPALAGTFAAGAASAFAPSRALVGTIAAGATTTSVVLSTALPTATVAAPVTSGSASASSIRRRARPSSGGLRETVPARRRPFKWIPRFRSLRLRARLTRFCRVECICWAPVRRRRTSGGR